MRTQEEMEDLIVKEIFCFLSNIHRISFDNGLVNESDFRPYHRKFFKDMLFAFIMEGPVQTSATYSTE